jgi:uncharacterized protein (DUF433 family)
MSNHPTPQWVPRVYKGYAWIVKDPDLLGGKLAIRGTRLSVAHVHACLAEGMTHEEIEESYGKLPRAAVTEVVLVVAELASNPNVAA